MMKIFVLFLFVSQNLANNQDLSITTISPFITEKKISVFSKNYEENFNMKIMEQIPCEFADIVKLEKMNLSIINDDFMRSNNIRHLSLHENVLTKIPTILKHLPSLTCLDLSKNKLNLNNSMFIEHRNLRVLDLSDQNPEFTNGKKHMEIIFNTNDMYLPNLEYLFLSGNNIKYLLDTFYKSFPKLTYIYLNNINATDIQVDFFNKMPKMLRVLHVENNKLDNLTLKNMTEITNLNLDGNELKNIEIISKKLKILSLSYGAAMGYINLYTPYLEYLDLTYNNFHSLPNIRYDNLQFLKTLLLDYNEFSSFPLFDHNLSLTKLSLSYNQLKYIKSKFFQHLTSLKMLSLRGNFIENIENNSFEDLKMLESLDISQNKLINLPNNWLSPLVNLRFLNTSSNYFTTMSDISINSFNSLTHLFVKDNTFTTISTTELEFLPNLITVYLD